ncbi:MAG: HK97-gp10 family putative phage morphogenesis protein [Nitrospinaceae bacterium]|nr:hypothetical protein [Rhodospirillales bacterium]
MTVKVEGLAELEAALLSMEATMGKKQLNKALRFATLPVINKMKVLVPKQRNRGKPSSRTRANKNPAGLLKTIKRRVVYNKYGHTASIEVGPRGKGSFYAKWVEFGTKPHKLGKGSYRASHGREVNRGGGNMHPGAKANSFVLLAWKLTARKALKRFKQKLKENLDKASK